MYISPKTKYTASYNLLKRKVNILQPQMKSKHNVVVRLKRS